jgi:hypothetical protein
VLSRIFWFLEQKGRGRFLKKQCEEKSVSVYGSSKCLEAVEELGVSEDSCAQLAANLAT